VVDGGVEWLVVSFHHLDRFDAAVVVQARIRLVENCAFDGVQVNQYIHEGHHEGCVVFVVVAYVG